MYLHKLDPPARTKVDEIMASFLPCWSGGLPLDTNLQSIHPINGPKIQRALAQVRLVFVCSLAGKLHVEFAPKCHWRQSWMMLMHRRRMPEYIVARTCPITGNALVWPAKFQTCNHIECFEYDTKDLLRHCPFCGRKKDTVVLDVTLKIVLDYVPQTADLISLKQNFSWSYANSPETYQDLLPFYKGTSEKDSYMPNTIFNT